MCFNRNSSIGFAILLAVSLVMVSHVAAADGGLNLPSGLIKIEVSDGTESYFITVLSNVPAGYDVENGTYVGWCVDRTAEMQRSPAIHMVRLYSSAEPPGTLVAQKWDMVNYILNHKQGSAKDIQQAIWYFINLAGNYTPTSDVGWAIINDAIANGSGFVPRDGQTIAIICFPVTILPQPTGVQISIIEISNPVSVSESPSLMISVIFAVGTLVTFATYKSRHLSTRVAQSKTDVQ
jgi:hypothetical protein